MGKGKTNGSGHVNGNVDKNGGRVEAGGKVTHQNGGTKVYVEGSVGHSRQHPTKGKGQTDGRIQIGISHDF